LVPDDDESPTTSSIVDLSSHYQLKTFDSESIIELVTEQTTLFWFRRDLRISDNAGLYRALKSNKNVLPLFIFDSVILEKLEDRHDRRVDFIHRTLAILKAEFENVGTSLLTLYGDPVKIFKVLSPGAVYTNHDYEPYARERDAEVKKILEAKGSSFSSFKDQVIFEKDEVLKDDGTPYTVFTPYSRKWKAKLNKFYLKSYPVEKYIHNFQKVKKLNLPTLADIGFTKSNLTEPDRVVKTKTIKEYHTTRNFPAIQGTTRLSIHLRFGTISIRKLGQIAQKQNETWLNELIWRDFYHMILWHFPHVEKRPFKAAYDHIPWRNNADEFERWCTGRTGYPIVDAGMRELNETGFMHNRVRMITASFLTKHLLIDWRWGEAYFASKLLDYDLAANNGGWQWAASSGCDAAPYFRIFNPELQTERFDPELKYVKKWVPELGTNDYPAPIVDHKQARERAIKTYKAALEKK
jgi:deoxyribodipyrimidine photo-lyase